MNIRFPISAGLCIAVLSLPCGAGQLEPGTLLGTTGQGDQLIVIDPGTGAGQLHAPIGDFGPVTDIEFCQGALIGSIGSGISRLVEMDPQTGDEFFRCNYPEGALTALQCLGDRLLAAFIAGPDEPSVLMVVGPPDANDLCSLTPVGPGVGNGTTGFGALGGMAFNPVTEQLFGCVTRFTPPATGPLIELDLSTGAGVLVGDTGLSRCGALTYGPALPPEGIDLPLYAGTGTVDAVPGALFDVFEGTGAATLIGPTGFDGISGLAFIPEPPDADEDGLPDFEDNCVFVFNPGQQDTNGDGIGNACDTDISDDCITNFEDLALFKAAFLTNPASPNWNPNADFNSDELVNFADLAGLKRYFLERPGPSGLPNACSPNLQVRLLNPPTTVSCPGGQGTCVHDVDLQVLEVNGQPVDQPFDVTVFTDNGLAVSFGLPGLPPGAVVPFGVTLGPGNNCYNPDCEVTAEVDSGGVVVETDEADNTDTRLDMG